MNDVSCPKITSVQEIEVFRFIELIEKYDRGQLQQALIHLFKENLKLYNTLKLLTARHMDVTIPLPNMSYEADMRKRLELVDDTTTRMATE